MILNGILLIEEFFLLLTCWLCFIILVSFQLYNYIKLKKEKNNKYWSKFIGINIASFIFTLSIFLILNYSHHDVLDILMNHTKDKVGILNYYMELNGYILLIISYIIFFIINIVSLKKALSIKKSASNPIKTNRSFIPKCIFIVLISTIIIVFTPVLLFNQYIEIDAQKKLKSMDKQYKNDNCKIVSVERLYAMSKFIYLDGYKYKIKCNSNTKTFEIRYNR